VSGTVPASESSAVRRFSVRHIFFITPLIVLHTACLLVFVVGWSWLAIAVFAITTLLQVFGITAGFHRLLTHQSYRTSRWFRCVMTFLGVLAGQNGPLWWVGHHRHHHRYSDSALDVHSPKGGFVWSHIGWLFSPKCVAVPNALVADLQRLPEMRFFQDYYYLVSLGYAGVLFACGQAQYWHDPAAGIDGWQLLVWGSVLSTVCSYHIIWSANSVCHRFGSRRFPTRDDSRNNFIVALLTLGDGWHHNHHFCPSSARHGFQWWELDVNYGILRVLELLGVVWDLRVPPRRAYLAPSAIKRSGRNRRDFEAAED
jgi:stearoyl-CoA desaturase (Delta-9 desaturase)